MVERGLSELAPAPGSFVKRRQPGLPGAFDLGEHNKVEILSVTEGADKPAKYPPNFRAASLMLIKQVDLAPYVDFDVAGCIALVREVNPDIEVLDVSATRGTVSATGTDGCKRSPPRKGAALARSAHGEFRGDWCGLPLAAWWWESAF